MPTNAAIYLRISQDRTGAGLGVDRQETDCRALAERLGWTISEVFVDNDISAYSGKKRPGYSSLLEALEAGRVQGVLAWHPDRLHRSPRELETYIDIAEARKISTHTVQAGAWDLSTPSGRAVARTVGAWARFESEHKSERIKAARQQSAIAGRFHGGVRPYGFDPDGVTVRPHEALEIVRAVEGILAGVSLRSLVRDLNAREVPTASGRGKWSSMALRDIMLSPRIAGLSTHLGEIVGEAVWPPLVPVDLWRGVVAVLKDPARRTSPGGAVRWLGSGLYVCGVCGEPRLRASTSGSKRGPAYRCASREEGSAGGHVVRDCRAVDAYVEKVLVARLSEPGLLGSMLDGDADMSEQRLELLAAEQRLGELADSFAAGEITRVQMARASATLREKVESISDEIAQASIRGPLAALAGADDVSTLWYGTAEDRSDGLSLGHRREILDQLATVTILKTGPGRTRRGVDYFNPDYVSITWKL